MYNHKEIEKKWQERWFDSDSYLAEDPTPTLPLLRGGRVGGVPLPLGKGEDGRGSGGSKKYILIEFPYPSGAGLHVGHVRSYTALDVLARKLRLSGENVLYPIGWDAFGLPTENYAIQHHIHPAKATEDNIAVFRRQIQALGISFDWSREINTTNPEYYKWTQWIFLQLFRAGLAYKHKMPINWCPSCKIGLANEEVVDGKCERCGAETQKKEKEQWMLAITKYAEHLLNDLDTVDFLPKIKQSQVNWIGRSTGAKVKFQVTINKKQTNPKIKNLKSLSSRLERSATEGSVGENNSDDHPPRPSDTPPKRGIYNDFIDVFTTRPDTIFGATYMVVSPEHELLRNFQFSIFNFQLVEEYCKKAKAKSDLERTDLNKDKSGVRLEGIVAINPATEEEIPIFVADYVLPHYGTGAIMAVPAHDERDLDFALKQNQIKNNKEESINIRIVVMPSVVESDFSILSSRPERSGAEGSVNETNRDDRSLDFARDDKKEGNLSECFTGEGVNINSGFLDGLKTSEATEKIIKWLEEKGIGEKKVNFKLRDWVFSRQHYWGEPIPLVYCESCANKTRKFCDEKKLVDEFSIFNFQFSINDKYSLGELLNPGWVMDENLPLTLPDVENYEPTDNGESPLAFIESWVNVKCPVCGNDARRETDTMPNWAGSSWYYLRYTDPHNNEAFADFDKMKFWTPVDIYNGGMEHTTLHLLYSRFWHKFLFDQGLVPTSEPYQRRVSHGMILASDGQKMSKSRGNVINPDDVIERYGADTLRIYEMFIGPYADTIPWNEQGIVGAYRFLEKIEKISSKCHSGRSEAKIQNLAGKSRKIPDQVWDDREGGQNDNFILALLHKTIKKVGEDIEAFKFNTAVSAMMILVNELEKSEEIDTDSWKKFLIILAPFAPHLSEELWEQMGNKNSIFQEKWPEFDPALIIDDTITLALQINGKLRDTIELPIEESHELPHEEALELAKRSEKIQSWLEGKEVVKVIYVKGKLINIVIK